MATTTRAACRALFTFLVVLGASASDDFASSTDVDTLDIKNNCTYRVAPVIAPGQGSPPLSFTPAELKGYEYVLGIPMPHGWSDRIWGRTDCSTDGNGKFTCAMVGDCGSGRLECDGGGGGGPAPASASKAARTPTTSASPTGTTCPCSWRLTTRAMAAASALRLSAWWTSTVRARPTSR
ncbi:thaumatin-like protein 1 [Miscanthus floridulus]|uniref:thaumatin-like protein 1 n=1 Tax=Miscanthus floridulus TaxID=154761 RepID=UPI0034599200